MRMLIATMLQVLPDATQNQTVQPIYTDNTSVWHHMSDALHQSLYRVLSLLIAVLPGILAFIVALAVFTAIGMVLSALLRRGLALAKFDERLTRERGVTSDWTPSSSPTAIIARVSFWACVLIGLIIGVSAFDASYATGAPLPISLLAVPDSCGRSNHSSSRR